MAGRLRLPTRPRDEARMTLIEHLEEFRSRIIKVGVAFIVFAVAAWFFRVQIYDWLLAPSGLQTLKFTSVASPVITDIKLTMYAALLVTLPFIIYQVWAFIAPAVGEVGRAFTYILIALSSSLFLAGVAFGRYIVLPVGLTFLINYASDRYDQIITADAYLGFVTRFLLAFGFVFELPAATFMGRSLGLIDAPMLRRYRRHAIVVSAVIAAALTADPTLISMLLMMAPMILLYEASILIASFVRPLSEVTPPESAPVNEDREEEDERDL